MKRFPLSGVLLGTVLAAGCGGGPVSYPDAPDTAEAKKEIEARDKKVDDLERAREKAAS